MSIIQAGNEQSCITVANDEFSLPATLRTKLRKFALLIANDQRGKAIWLLAVAEPEKQGATVTYKNLSLTKNLLSMLYFGLGHLKFITFDVTLSFLVIGKLQSIL